MERSGDLIGRTRRQRHHESSGRQSFDQWLFSKTNPIDYADHGRLSDQAI
jgi:hypothetical protein